MAKCLLSSHLEKHLKEVHLSTDLDAAFVNQLMNSIVTHTLMFISYCNSALR